MITNLMINNRSVAFRACKKQDGINFELLPLIFHLVTPLTAIYQTQSKQKWVVKKKNKRTVVIAEVVIKRWEAANLEGPPEGGVL